MMLLAACQHPPSDRSPTETLQTDLHATPHVRDADVIIIGAGISGLSAAIEISNAGLHVLVIEMGSVFGGHAVMAGGVLNIPVSKMQLDMGIADSKQLAVKDFLSWGEDANENWVRQYVDLANTDIFDWLVSLGVRFDRIVKPPGNTVPRVHIPAGGGFALISAIYRNVLTQNNIKIRLNSTAIVLLQDGDRVTGVRIRNTRSDRISDLHANAIVVATGGFQNNIQKVMDNWPSDLPKPKQILAGSGVNSLGSGLELAAAVDASIERLDHQWNYIGGIPHPSGNNDGRGLRFFVEPGTADLGIYVNELGQRFTNECSSVKTNLAKVLAQPNQRYWYVFDANNKTNLRAGGIGWTKKSIERNIFSNPRLVKVADSVAALAGLMQVNPKALQATIKRYNLMANRGSDSDFGRFGPQHPAHGCSIASTLATPPYYAIQRLPLSRKSMGGIQVDLETHVLNVAGKKIPGLYAVGEVTGFAGINGRAGLEGTFLGPSIVMGRVAGRVIASEIRPGPAQDILAATELVTLDMTQNEAVCSDCHQLPTDSRTSRPGYEHFGWVHQLVQGRQQPCALCHSDLMPLSLTAHRSNLLQQISTCTHCHGGGD